jgi:hypothetical protein
MKTIKAVTLTLAFLSSFSIAQEGTYNFDAGGLISSYTSTDSSSQSIKGIGGTYYFSPVKVESDEPYAERHFVQKVSNATLLYGTNAYEASTLAKTDLTQLTVAGELHINSFVLSASNASWKGNFPYKTLPQYQYEIKNDTNAFAFGYYFTPLNYISASQSSSKATYTRNSVNLTNLLDYTITTTKINSKNLFKINQEQFAVLSLSYSTINYKQSLDQSNNSYGVSGRYYPSKATYLQADYSAEQGDKKANVGNTVSLEFGIAVTPRLIASFSSSQFNVSDSAQGSNSTSNQLLASYRF